MTAHCDGAGPAPRGEDAGGCGREAAKMKKIKNENLKSKPHKTAHLSDAESEIAMKSSQAVSINGRLGNYKDTAQTPIYRNNSENNAGIFSFICKT